MQVDVPRFCLVALTLGCVVSTEICQRGKTWWNPRKGECVPCTKCDHTLRQAIQYPCEIHRDSICQSIDDISIDHIFGPNRDYDEYYSYVYTDDVLDDDDGDVNSDVQWNLQTVTLVVASSGCMVFFVVVLAVSVYHAKQWKMLKRALQSDVQELSAKLMLMEAGDSPVEPIKPTDHHIYCNVHAGKHALLGTPFKGAANVYTQQRRSP